MLYNQKNPCHACTDFYSASAPAPAPAPAAPMESSSAGLLLQENDMPAPAHSYSQPAVSSICKHGIIYYIGLFAYESLNHNCLFFFKLSLFLSPLC